MSKKDKNIEQSGNDTIHSAFMLKPDSMTMGLADKNTGIAIFKNKKHAHSFGKMMYEKYYIVEEVQTKHFV